MGKLTDYTREQIKQFINDGICPVQTLRDYELLKQIENGSKITHVADDNNIARSTLHRMRNKYIGKL